MPAITFEHEIYPEDYYMSRQENGDTIWDVEVQIETGYPAGTAVLKRRAKWIINPGTPDLDPQDPTYQREQFVSGYQMVNASPDAIAVYLGEFEHTVQAVYQQWVHAEIWNETHQYWDRLQPISKSSTILYEPILDENENIVGYTDRVIGIEYTADFGLGNYLKTLINYNWFTGNVNKHTYYFYWPGVIKRVYTQLQVYDESKFHMDLSDFNGPYEVIEQAGLTNIIYYPDGVVTDECEVDPYLGTEELTNQIRVSADGYIFSLYHGNSTSQHILRDPQNNQLCLLSHTYIVSGVTYSIHFDTSRFADVMDEGPNFVMLELSATFVNSTQGGPYTGNPVKLYYYFYEDRIFIELRWTVNGSSIVLDNTNDNAFFDVIVQSAITGELAIYEFIGSELTGLGLRNTADYIGFRSDQLNVVMSTLFGDNSSLYEQYNQANDRFKLRWNNGTIPIGTHHIAAGFLIDSQDRENDAGSFNTWITDTPYTVGELVVESNLRYFCVVGHTSGVFATDLANGYWLEHRISFGNQCQSQSINMIEGTKLIDTNIPLWLNPNDMTSDGAFPLEESVNNIVQYSLSLDTIKQQFILYDPPYLLGDPDTPIDLLTGYWKLDDNAANTTLLATVGNDELTGLQGGNNTNQVSTTDAIRGRALDLVSGDYVEIDPTQYITDMNVFTVHFKFKPTFTYDTTSGKGIFFLRPTEGTSANYITVVYSQSSDTMYLYMLIGGTSYHTFIRAGTYTTNYQLQQWHNFWLCCDLNKGFFYLKVNQNHKIINTTTTWSLSMNIMRLNNTNFGFGESIFEDLKLFDGCVMRHGGGAWKGNGSINDQAYHSDISFYTPLDDITSPTASIADGSDVITVGGSPTLVAGPTGAVDSAIDFSVPGAVLTFESANNFDTARGNISFWFKSNVGFNSTLRFLFGPRAGTVPGEFLIFFESGTNQFFIQTQDSLNNAVYVAFNQTAFNNVDADIQQWNYYRIKYDNQKEVYGNHHIALFVNSGRVAPSASSNVANPWTAAAPPADMSIGNDSGDTGFPCNGALSRFEITQDPNTPDVWSQFGEPLHLPIMDEA